MSIGLAPVSDGLRAHLEESDWVTLVAAVKTAHAATLDDPLAAAAALALGAAPIHIEVQTGTGDRGVFAQLGCDAVATGIAVRALVAAPDGSEPTAIPGVELGANQTTNLVAELMRLFPAGGLTRHGDRAPVTLPHELSLSLHHALAAGDTTLARHVAQQAGWFEPPEVLVSLARGAIASATVTVRVTGHPTTVVQQWLLCDLGWVLLTVRGTRVTHTLQSRDEVHDELVRTVAGAFAAQAVAERE
jgi:hypothetical protein